MKIFHVSLECYPMAKVGGLADVVGALPKYLNTKNHTSSVVIPKYDLPWFQEIKSNVVHEGQILTPYISKTFTIEKVDDNGIGFPFYVIDIPSLFDRKGIYSDEYGVYFKDESTRHVFFQRAFLQWMSTLEKKPSIVHCHDHHTGLIPYMMKYCTDFYELSTIPTVFTIHNQRYQGIIGWEMLYLLPYSETKYHGLLEWNNAINSIASGVKCATVISTVSPNYMKELKVNSYGLEWLFNHEAEKCQGILNGIDATVWNPRRDKCLHYNLKGSVSRYKLRNKQNLCNLEGLNSQKPLVSYIGRMAGEKGADMIAPMFRGLLHRYKNLQLLVLGTGNKEVEMDLEHLEKSFSGRVKFEKGYDEELARNIYAGTDFLIMPSRIEPCGLNQMYALAYGAIPIVNATGGLVDTITSYKNGGNGVLMEGLKYENWETALSDALQLYEDTNRYSTLCERNMEIDHTWTNTSKQYIKLYKDAKRRI